MYLLHMLRAADNGGDGISLDESVESVNVTNSIVDTTGFIYMQQPTGIRVKGQRNISITHNEVLHVPYGGILVGWQVSLLNKQLTL